MSQEKIERVTVDPATGYEQQSVEVRPSGSDIFIYRLQQVVLLIGGIVVTLLLVRIAFVALGANPNNEFAAFLYRITDVLLAPFATILSNKNVGGVVIDLPSCVAIVIYAILASIIARVLSLFRSTGGVRTVRRVQRLS